MKNIIIVILLFSFISNVRAQDEVQYLEVFPFVKGWKYRISPKGEFKKIGFLGQKLKPYFQDNPAAKSAFRKYEIGQSLFLASNAVTLTGVGMIAYGFSQNDPDIVWKGLIVDLTGLCLTFITSQMSSTYLYSAIDAFNYKRSPVTSSFLPSLQLSDHSLGLGLVWGIK